MTKLPAQVRTTLVFLGFLALYLACAWVGVQLIASPDSVPLFWPASGVALALVVMKGLRWAVLVPIAGLIIHLVAEGPAGVPGWRWRECGCFQAMWPSRTAGVTAATPSRSARPQRSCTTHRSASGARPACHMA